MEYDVLCLIMLYLNCKYEVIDGIVNSNTAIEGGMFQTNDWPCYIAH